MLLLKRQDDKEWDEQFHFKFIMSFVQEKLTELQFQFQELPQVIIDIIKRLTDSNIQNIMKIDDMHNFIKNSFEKGQQTDFRNDSLAAYLQFHKEKYLPQVFPWIYLCQGNQIHLYNHETQKFHYLKVYRKKKSYNIISQVVYSPDLDNFFFFSHSQSNILLKVYDEAHNKPLIFYRREVELFRNFKELDIENPDLVYVQANQYIEDNINLQDGETNQLSEQIPPSSFIYIMNNQFQEDPNQQVTFFGSYVIYIGYEEEESAKGQSAKLKVKSHDLKKVIKVFEGPRNYIYRQYSYHFYDPHNHLIYCMIDSQNIFAKGIKYQYFDTLLDSGHFKEGVLRFACANKDQYLKFCQFKVDINKISYCTEVQHGVYIMHASRNIFILDFNFKCFYSLASYQQISNFKINKRINPLRYSNIYETINQPFQIFQIKEQSKNAVFQEGHLLVLARNQIETILCVYEIIPNQGQIILRSCVSLYSGQNLLSRLPKNIKLILQDNYSLQVEQSKKIIKQIEIYKCTDFILQEGNEYFYKAESSQNQKFCLHQVNVDSLQQITKLFQSFTDKVDSQWILNPIRYFTVQENRSKYSMVYITEEIIHTMKKEIEIRRISQNQFQPKELALIIKLIFKGLLDLQAKNLHHGNLNTNALCLTRSGIIKIGKWYSENRDTFKNDTQDALKLIYSISTLNEFPSDKPIVSLDIEENSYRLSQYVGLTEFLQKYLKNPKLNLASQAAFEISQKLMASEINFHLLKSNNQILFQIEYGQNQIIIFDFQRQEFQKIDVTYQNGNRFNFNKHMSFTYDYASTIYFTGAFLEENMQFQQFYMIKTIHINNQVTKVNKLQDIPFPLYSPTVVIAGDFIYLIGGYEVNQNLTKSISNLVLNYDIKLNQWRFCPKLPFGLVNSTALYRSGEKKIFVMGGLSEKIEYSANSFAILIYDIDKEFWEFTIDPSFDCPFTNSRFQKPIIDLINEFYFISYEKRGFVHHLHIFELIKGGLSLKYDIQDHNEIQIDMQKHNESQFLMDEYDQQEDFQQSDPIMAVKQDTVYVMEGKQLNKFKFTNPLNPTFEFVTYTLN